jgi:hypothetical protein
MFEKPWSKSFHAPLLTGALLLCGAAPALAEEPAFQAPASAASAPRDGASTRHAFNLGGAYSNVDAAAILGYRLRLSGGLQLGAEVRYAPSRRSYIDGFATTGGAGRYGTLRALVPLASSGPLELGLGTTLGVRSLAVDTTTGLDKSSLAFTSEIGPGAHLQLTRGLTLRAGWLQVTNLQTRPNTALDALGQVLLLGATAPVTDTVQLYADFETGGLFGYDGDGGKYLTRGIVGARWVLGGAARDWMTAF